MDTSYIQIAIWIIITIIFIAMKLFYYSFPVSFMERLLSKSSRNIYQL